MQTAAIDPSKRYVPHVYVVTTLGHALCHINILVFSAILIPLSQEFELSMTRITGIGSLSLLFFGLGSFPAGILTRIKNPRFMLMVYYAGCAGSSIIIWLSSDLLMFSVGLSLLSAFCSIYHTAGLTLISHSLKKLGKPLGVHGVAGSGGITIAPFFAGILAVSFGWRSVYLVLALIAAAGFFYLLFNTSIPTGSVVERTQPATSKKSMVPFFLVLIITIILTGFVYRSFLTIFPTYLSQKVSLKGVSPVLTGGFLASAVLALGMIGQYVGGFLSDRLNRIGLYGGILGASAVILIVLGFSSGIGLILTAALFSLVFFPQQPVENSIVSLAMPPKMISSFFGFKFALTFGVGGLGAVFAGFIADTISIEAVFWSTSIIAAAASITAFILLGISRKRKIEL